MKPTLEIEIKSLLDAWWNPAMQMTGQSDNTFDSLIDQYISDPIKYDYLAMIDAIKKIEDEIEDPRNPQSPISTGKDLIERNIRNTVAIFPRKEFDSWEMRDGNYYPKQTQLNERRFSQINGKICANPPFLPQEFMLQQSVNLRGTGFFIKKDVIATAAHVFQDDFEPKNYVFVRGLVFPDCLDEKGNIIIPHENVFWSNKKYRKLRDETSSYSLTNSDWALIQIDRHHTSSIDIETDHVTDNQAVYCLGHPLGLLMKRSYNAKVIQPHSASNFDYYETQLDAFVGNSGSPVFDAKSHNLVGIFVRGRVAIVEGPGGLCKTITPVCTETQGHECQKISPVADALELV